MSQTHITLLLLLLTSVSACSKDVVAPAAATEERPPRRFKAPPDKAGRLAALGPLDGIPRKLRRALTPDAAFAPIPAPKRGDWLAEHPERPQSFARYVASRPNRPDRTRRVIYLLPIGAFDAGKSPRLETLREYASAFFGLEAKLMPAVATKAVKARKRRHQGRKQLRSTDILNWLGRQLPADAYCLIGLTMTDLYPQPGWNFVFGQASLKGRVGVYSFARYDPGEGVKGRRALLMRRSFGVLAHEVGHMFGIEHCTHYHCVMNGSNSLEETDAGTAHLCPVCLRKLDHAKGIAEPGARYRRLAPLYRKEGMEPEASWVEGRAKRIDGP